MKAGVHSQIQPCVAESRQMCGGNGGAVIKSVAMTVASAIARLRVFRRRGPGSDGVPEDELKEDPYFDPVPLDEQTPWWMWTGGLAAGTILTMLVMRYQFGQNAGVTLLAILFSFLFSLVGAECTGRVSVTPVTTLGNFAQLVFGGISKGTGLAPMANQLNNGLTGMITLAASEQVADMLGMSPRLVQIPRDINQSPQAT